jgi:hypothetical protein
MARRPLAGKDQKIIQGHRRDAFFKKMRQKGGVPRLPTAAPEVASEPEVAETPTAPEPETEVVGETETGETASAAGDQRSVEG